MRFINKGVSRQPVSLYSRMTSNGGMDKIKAGIQCRGMDIRKGRDVDVRNGREMVAGLNRKREDLTSP
ncbi:MAG: hypothetical protein MR794_00130 [Bacteroidales bacterium]|nr:hypothetical protein [Bacteroidales bacterium]